MLNTQKKLDLGIVITMFTFRGLISFGMPHPSYEINYYCELEFYWLYKYVFNL